MTVETAVYLNALDSAKPANTELVAEGDDHLRLLKSVLKATFPGRGLAEKQPIAKTITFAPGLDEVSVLFLAKGATQANLPAISGLANGTHYWFWAEDNDLTLTTLDTALVNGAATLLLEQGTGACVIYTGTGWVAVGLGGGGGEQVNLIEGANILITGTYPDLTVEAVVPEQLNLTEGDYATVTGTYPDLVVDALPLNAIATAPLNVSGSYPDITWSINAQPSCVFKTTKTDDYTHTTSTTPAKVAWNSEIYDTEGALLASPDTFEAPFAGYYQINVRCSFNEGGAAYVNMFLRKNFSDVEEVKAYIPAVESVTFTFDALLSTIVYLDIGDIVDVRISTPSGNITLVGARSFFSGSLIPLGLS